MWKKVKHFVGIPPIGDELDEMDEFAPRHSQGHSHAHNHTVPVVDSVLDDNRQARNNRRSRPVNEKGNPINNIIGLNATMSQSEMLIVEPKSFDDALDIVESLRNRKAVIINLTGLEQEQAQRLIDFVAGATHALDGNQERVGEGIFLFSPSNVMINSLGTDQPWLNRDARDLFWRVK